MLTLRSISRIVSNLFASLCVLALTFGGLAASPVRAQKAQAPGAEPPAGLSAADWGQIKALLPAPPAPVQQAYLKASNTGINDIFGWSVAIDGNTVAVGAPGASYDFDAGAVYVFTRSGDTWSQQAILSASNAEAGDCFGYNDTLALSGDTLVVGDPCEDSNATGINGNQADNSAQASGAAYVFRRSGTDWVQRAYLKASNTGTEDGFGSSLAISGDTLVVGADGEKSSAVGVDGNQSDNSAADAGAAYVFTRNRSTWTWSQQAYLKASNTGAGDRFGLSVALSGDTLVVGAPGEASNAVGVDGDQADNSAQFSGAAYVFTRSGASWSQQAYLKASNSEVGDSFGVVALEGDLLVVGAAHESSAATGLNGNQADNSAPYAGAAYIFTRSGSTWSQQTYLKASNTGENDYFGASLALSGSTLIVGASWESSNATGINGDQADNSASESGAVYIFTYDGSSWGQQAYLKASNTDANDHFGWSVAVSGYTLMVGALSEASNATGVNGDQANNATQAAGAGYVFVLPGSPVQQAYVKASNTGSVDYFGNALGLSGNTLAVGAWAEDSAASGVNGDQTDNSASDSGAVYVFNRSDSSWSQQAYLKASNTEAGDGFGASLALDGDTLVVGAPLEDSAASGVNGDQADNSAADSGAVYVFTRSGSTWSQQAYLKASNTGAGDWFGNSVAIFGDTLVVGAEREGSAAGGVNGDQADNSAPSAGAIYVFTRSGSTWSQQAYIKASNAGAGDSFGFSTAISGDTLVVGAIGEASNASGPNGNQADNSAQYAGAVYVFTRSGSTWSQQAYLKASNTDAGDWFGFCVALDGNTLVVGAIHEASAATIVNGDQNDNSTEDAGAAYVFTRSGSTWSQQAYLKASDAELLDMFGSSVGVDGNNIVVGLRAAYLFTRTGNHWSQRAAITGSNTGSGMFGMLVAISGGTLVVGAPDEPSSATGIDGDQTDTSAPQAGAAYVFVIPDTTAPTVTSIVRADSNPTHAANIHFTVTFSEPVMGVDASDFSLNTNDVTGASITAVSGSDSTYTISVDTGSGAGDCTNFHLGSDGPTIGLNVLADGSILDAAGLQLSVAYTGGEKYDMLSKCTLTIWTAHGQGTVTRDPDQAWYYEGDTVQLTAAPEPGWHFVSWSGDLTGTANPTSIVIYGNTTITANYAQTEHSLRIISSPNGEANIYPEPGWGNYFDGMVEQLTAVPHAGWSFTNWSFESSAGTMPDSEANPVSLTMHSDIVATPHFTQIEYNLTIDSAHGTVARNPDKSSYHEGDVVQLTAVPGAGWVFTKWTGALTGSANPASVTIHGDSVVTANYAKITTLALQSIGSQDGWVLESSETSGLGGSLNNTASTFRLGDDAARRQYRGVLSFSTGGRLPDNAVITGVRLRLKRQGLLGPGNPVATLKGFMAEIKNGVFGGAAGLQNGDFQVAGSHAAFGPFLPEIVGNWYTLDLSGAKAYVNKLAANGGLTQIRLRFKLDDNNDAVANVLSLFSGNAGPADRPQLVITYYVP